MSRKRVLPLYMNYVKYLHDDTLARIHNKIRSPLKVGTDCSGIDAPIHALDVLGIPITYEFASDIDKNAKESIMCNHSPKMFFDDITSRNHRSLPKIDLYVAGFPCQAFSTLGKREGFMDTKDRGIVFFHCLETIKSTSPQVFILENVKGLTNHDNGKTFNTIITHLENLHDYQVFYQMYNTVDYGIPQSRERIYIVGIRSGGSLKLNPTKFKHPSPIPLPITIRDIIDKNVRDPYYYELTDHKVQLLDDLVASGTVDTLDNDWLVNLNVSTYKRCGARQDISPCILAGEGGNCTYYLTSERRRLTEIEYLRLQGFPPSYKICVTRSKVYKQAGNAMSVNVIAFIIKSALSC